MDQSPKDKLQSDNPSHCPVMLGTFINADSMENRTFVEIVALSADMYWQENCEGICTAVYSYSASMQDAAEQLLFQRFSAACHSSESPADWQSYTSLTNHHKSFRKLSCVLETGGSRYHLEISGIPQFDAAGEFTGYQCTAIDKSHDHQRRSSLLRFRAAVDMSMDMIYLVDRDTLSFLDVNDTACHNAGLSREQLLATGPAKILGLSELELAARYDHLIRDGGSSRIERMVKTMDGASAIIEVYSRATCIDGHWIIIGVSRDISDRKRAELRALQLQQMFSALSLTNEAILRADSVSSLYQSACTAAVSCELFTIATILEPCPDGLFRAAANAGNVARDLKSVKIGNHAASAEGRGISGQAFREQRAAIANDLLNDPRTADWRDISIQQEIASGAALPLFRYKECVAVMLFYASDKDAFDEEIMAILQSMADNISYALGNFATAEKQQRAAALNRENEARFRSLTNLTSDFYWEMDAALHFTKYQGRLIGDSNKRAAAMLIGHHIWELPGVKPDSVNWLQFRRVLKREEQFRDYEFSFTNESGQLYHFALSGEPISAPDGRFMGYRGISRDITEKKHIANHIKHLATHDTLTGLPNRVMFSELLRQAIRNARRYKDQHFAVLFIDLDRFKSVNDTYGHHTGDQLLTEVASRLQQPLRTSDIVARLGGDEFVVLLHRISTQERASHIAGNILKIFNLPIALDNREFVVTASIGISLYGIDANSEELLMTHADTAMYAAKEEGRNNFRCYSADLHHHTQERAGLALQLGHALARGELELHYQAKLELATGNITGVEALLRWNHPTLGEIPPSQFIPIAEDNGLIVPIGDWVMATACRQLVSWQQQGSPILNLAVNLSPRQFNNPDLHKRIREVLNCTGLSPELLELEITESLVVQNPERAIATMKEIKRMGVRFALDDFGTGYSSLGQLRHYPLDTLKIDRVFVRDLDHSKEDQAISKAILSLGKTLGLTVVAEGVETSRQIEFLKQYQCDQIQGFYCHQPSNAEKFLAWLRQQQQPLSLGPGRKNPRNKY